MIDRGEIHITLQRLDAFYRSAEGLQRPTGLAFDNPVRADLEAMAAWIFDVYLNAREAGVSAETAWTSVVRAIQNTDEWRSKHPPVPPVPSSALQGAFCIPKALFGDRLWWPNFLNEPEQRQDEMIRQTLARRYNHGEIQVSGVPYPGYPEIPLDATLLAAGLTKMRAAGLTTVVAFRDDRGPDLSYLRPVLAQVQALIDWSMGVYECNGVLRDPLVVLDVLKQSRSMLPNAKLAVHFTAQDPGTESYGLVDWQRAKDEAGLNAYFFQVSGWLDGGLENGINRIADWTRRLMGGFHGYPVLSDGVVDFENTTTKTFRNEWSEVQGVTFTDALMNAPLVPDQGVMSVRPSGFGDGGTP